MYIGAIYLQKENFMTSKWNDLERYTKINEPLKTCQIKLEQNYYKGQREVVIFFFKSVFKHSFHFKEIDTGNHNKTLHGYGLLARSGQWVIFFKKRPWLKL